MTLYCLVIGTADCPATYDDMVKAISSVRDDVVGGYYDPLDDRIHFYGEGIERVVVTSYADDVQYEPGTLVIRWGSDDNPPACGDMLAFQAEVQRAVEEEEPIVIGFPYPTSFELVGSKKMPDGGFVVSKESIAARRAVISDDYATFEADGITFYYGYEYGEIMDRCYGVVSLATEDPNWGCVAYRSAEKLVLAHCAHDGPRLSGEPAEILLGFLGALITLKIMSVSE